MLAAINGVPGQIVSDNLHAGITRACFYEPLVNRTYADMASHYGTAVIPARPYKPRDKVKVEVRAWPSALTKIDPALLIRIDPLTCFLPTVSQ